VLLGSLRTAARRLSDVRDSSIAHTRCPFGEGHGFLSLPFTTTTTEMIMTTPVLTEQMRRKNWAMACANVAAWIVALARRNAMLWGSPGKSKTASMQAFAKAQGMEFLLLIGSNMAPEDVGGIPHVLTAEQFFRAMPPFWAERLTRPGVVVGCDEFTCTPPSVRAPLQTMFSDRKIGQMDIHPDNILLAAANPPKWAPNASPMEKAMANRFVHFDFIHNYEAWKKGMSSERDEWGKVWIPTMPGDWRRFVPKWGDLINSYLDKNSNDRDQPPPESDDENAYPTPRSWHVLRDCLAAAEAVGAPGMVESALCHGAIGKVVGANFLRFKATLDLMDPEEVLSGKKQFRFDSLRPDLASAMLVSLVSALKSNFTTDRLDVASEVFCIDIGKHAADLAFTQLRHLVNTRPEGSPIPPKSLKIISEFGKNVPPEVRNRGKS